MVGCIKLGTSSKHKKTFNTHTVLSKLSFCSSTLQKYESKERKLLKFDLLMFVLEQLGPSVQV